MGVPRAGVAEPVVNRAEHDPAPAGGGYVPYDRRKLSYARTFTNPWQAEAIRAIEWLTGKATLVRLIREFERIGVPAGQMFWPRMLDVMGIERLTPEEQIGRIPATGPLVVVANHPHGLVDGMILADLVGRVRQDYKILTRSLLTDIREIRQFMIPVPFPHEKDALAQSLEMRRCAMEHLRQGGVIMLFPAGVVASSDNFFGPVIERIWNPFTAKMVLRSDARVLPIHFRGTNSRWYQIANRISPILRQGMLLHEVVHALNRPQSPVIGAPIDRAAIEGWRDNPRGLVAWLREQTLALLGDHRVGTGASPR